MVQSEWFELCYGLIILFSQPLVHVTVNILLINPKRKNVQTDGRSTRSPCDSRLVWQPREVWQDVGEKRLLRESEYLLNTMDISSTLSFSPYDSKMVIFSFYRRKTNLERLSNMLRKASSKVWM